MIPADQFLRQFIQLEGGDARPDSQPDLILHFAQDFPRVPHFGDLRRVLQADHACAPSALMMAAKVLSSPCAPSTFFSRPFCS